MRLLLTVTLLFLLSSCSLFSPIKSPEKNYILTYQQNVHKKVNSNKTVYVADISSVPWLETSKMAYQLSFHELNYFALHQWAAPPSELLKPVITDALQQSGKYKGVFSSMVTNNFDKEVNIKILDFQQEFTQKPSVYHIRLEINVIDHKTQSLLRTKMFSLSLPSESETPEGGVKAANQIIQQMLPGIVKFI